MKNIFRGLTMAVAIGAMSVPNIASAAQHGPGSGARSGGGHVGMSRSGGNFARSGNVNRGVAVRSFNNKQNFAKVQSSRNFATVQNRNVNGNNFARSNNGQRWVGNNGQRWAGNGRHHRHYRGWWGPGLALGAYGLYSTYDTCWDTVWTPAGYQRVYVCGPDYYNYY